MKWMILGANGMLGEEMFEYLKESDRNCLGYSHSDLDITKRNSLQRTIEQEKPDVVVNAAAYTDVDGAETQIKKALRVNGEALKYLAEINQQRSFLLVHISTDYVFSSKKKTPFKESDTPSPINTYGISKRVGELFLKAYGRDWLLIRTSGLYGGNPEVHSSFVSAILENINRDNSFDVVKDQVTSPTWTRPLVKKIVQLVDCKQEGLFHLTSSGSCSWYEFATSLAEKVPNKVSIQPVSTKEFPADASRPSYSVLKSEKNETSELGHWKENLIKYLEKQDLK